MFQSKVELIRGRGAFAEDGTVEVNGQKYRGRHTLIAVGGRRIFLVEAVVNLGVKN